MTTLRFLALFVAIFTTLSSFHAFAAGITLVENAQPRAEIVIAGQPLRTVRLAAQELQDDIKTLSGARLPIVTQPSEGVAAVYVGRSEHTDRLKISTEGLKYGAYRISVGDTWLVLIGDDQDFRPI